jgi:hypothetical protein
MSNKEVKAMEAIMEKLNNVTANAEHVKKERAAGKEVVSKDATEMYDILKKLQTASETATKKMLVESPEEAAVSTKKDNKISMGEYVIEMDRQEVAPKVFKTYYNISSNGELEHTLALFESAMAVLKHYATNTISSTRTSRIISLDEKYDSYLLEAAQHKSRASTVKESFKIDVYTAKQGQAVAKMKQIKQEIMSLI